MQRPIPAKVLVIEDQPVAAAGLRNELNAKGYQVTAVAASGEEALGSIEKSPPDLVIVGSHFQKQAAGVEIAEVVRNLCNIPVTLSTPQGDSVELTAAGGSEAITRRGKAFWLSTALNSAADGIAMIDPQGVVQFLNPVAQYLTGYTQKQAAGHHFSEVLQFEHQGVRIVDDLLRLATLNEEPLSLGPELVLISRSGQHHQVEAEIAAGSEAAGAFGSAVFTFRDVTRRKWEEYQNRQEYAVRAVERLAETTAHTLNNLLTTILGNAELVLSDNGLPPDHRDSVLQIQSAAVQAADVTRQLSTMSRKNAVVRQDMDINELIESFLPLLRNSLPQGITLATELVPVIPAISADRAQIEQVLFNLVMNARDAIKSEGAITITTQNMVLDAAERSRTARSYVNIQVRDTGEGMTRETMDSMFEPFFTTRGGAGHVGLGLSITQGIIRDYKGFLTVESSPGAGTTMTFTLPAIEADTFAYVDQTAAVPDSLALKTILIVEDDHAVRLLIRKILERHDYAVIEAEAGEDAMMAAYLSEGRVDLLITDVVMPGISGPDLVRQFAPVHPETKFLLISGLSAEKIGAASSLPQGIEFLKKPFNQKELLGQIQSLLEGSTA